VNQPINSIPPNRAELERKPDHDLLVIAVEHIAWIRSEAALDRKEIKLLSARIGKIEMECAARGRVTKAMCQAKKQSLAARMAAIAVAGVIIAGISVIVNLVLNRP